MSVTGEWLKSDVRGNTRFRPIYIIHRIVETKIFGTNFRLWSIYHGLLFAVALISFFLAARNLRFSLSAAFLFITVIFIGPQTAVLWRLGPGEGLAMTFLGIAFLFMSQSSGSPGTVKHNILFIIFLLLAAFTKESFLLAVPAILFLKVSIYARNNNINIYKAAFRNLYLLVPLIAVGVGLVYIFLFVGTGYASEGQSIGSTVQNMIFSFLILGKLYLFPLILLLILFIIRSLGVWHSFVKSLTEPVLFLLLITVPNLILYSSTGLEERYLLPSTIGFAYLMIIVLVNFKSESPLFRKAAIAASFLVFVPQFLSASNSAAEFSRDGKETGILLKAISDKVEKGKPVLLIADPVESYELSVSLKTWLAATCDIQLQGYALVKDNETAENKIYVDGWNSYFKGNLFEASGTPPGLLIFLDKSISKKFTGSSVLDLNGNYWLLTETSRFALYGLN